MSLSVRLAAIVRGAVAALGVLGPLGVASGPVLVAILACVERRLRRFERLMARLAAGRPASAQRPRAAQAAREPGRRTRMRRASLVPRGRAWAVKMSRETAALGSQLHALLSEPGAADLLRRTPEAAAMLRPLCRMLGTALPDALQAAKPPAPPRVRRAHARRPAQLDQGPAWPGARIWRQTWEAAMASAALRAARPPPWRPPPWSAARSAAADVTTPRTVGPR